MNTILRATANVLITHWQHLLSKHQLLPSQRIINVYVCMCSSLSLGCV